MGHSAGDCLWYFAYGSNLSLAQFIAPPARSTIGRACRALRC